MKTDASLKKVNKDNNEKPGNELSLKFISTVDNDCTKDNSRMEPLKAVGREKEGQRVS